VTMKYKLPGKKPNTVTLLMLISYATVSAVLFAPGLPEMSSYYAVSNSAIQFAVVTFLFAYASGQLFYGILSNRFGRKATISAGLLMGVAGAIMCIVSGRLVSFELLLIGRFVEALGAGVGLALTFIIIGDYYYPAQAVKITAWAAIAFAISPGISSTIGGVIVSWLGWQYCFWFLAIYGLLIALLCTKLPETSAAEQRVTTVNTAKILAAYRIVFTNKQLVSFSILVGSTSAILYVFLSVAPLIVINMLGVRPDTYGLLNMILTLGLVSGNIIVLRSSTKTNPAKLIKYGVITVSSGIVLLTGCFGLEIVNTGSIFAAGFIIFLGIALLYSSATTFAMADIHNKAYGAAAMSFMNAGTACFAIILVSLLPVTPLITLAVVLLLFLLVMLRVYSLGKG